MLVNNLSKYKETIKNTYCIYIVDPKAHWVKIGYGTIQRPGSNEYFTGYLENADIIMMVTSMNKEECFVFEQGLHKFLGKKFTVGEAGIECYKTSQQQAYEAITHFFKKKDVKITEIIKTSVCEIRKTFDKTFDAKGIQDMCLVEYNKLIDCDIMCELCRRICSKVSYECTIVSKSDENNEESVIYTGPNCFRKLEQSYLTYPPKFQSIFKNRLGHDPVIHFIDQYLIDSRITAIPVKSKIDINNLLYKSIDPLILRIICHYMFVKKGSFNVELTREEFDHYELDIDIEKVYYILTFSIYFEIGDFDTNNESFSIKFIHPDINVKSLLNYFNNLKSNIFNYSEKLDKDSHKLDEIQQSFLKSQNPFISGVPGSGKSQIAKYILHTLQKNILVFSPTYQSLELLLGDNFDNTCLVKDRSNVKGLVIDAWNKNRTDLKKEYDVLIVDEFYMLDIFQLYKIKLVIEQYEPSYIKIFGDLYQLQCISFKKETENILKNIHLKSHVLTKNYRAEDYPDQVNYLDLNKTYFKNLHSLKGVFDVKNYSESIIEERRKLKDHVFLSSTNNTKDKINYICYKNYKNNCVSCSNDIKVKNYEFCSLCIAGIKWVINSNFKYKNCKYDTYTKDDAYTKLELLELPETNDIKYSNIVRLNKCKKPEYESVDTDSIMLYNGQRIRIKINSDNKFDILISNKKLLYIYDIEDIKLSLGFCMTTHKAQGSTYENVSFIVDRNDISSDLVFTALTRAKNMNTILIINKTEQDDIYFNKTPFDDNTDDKFTELINRRYYPKNTEHKYYGKKYIDIYIQIKEGNYKEKNWLYWMMGKKTNAKPPVIHRNIFNECERFIKQNP